MTKKGDPNPVVMLLNHGLMKIRLVSASGLLFLPLAGTPFIPVPRKGFPGGNFNKHRWHKINKVLPYHKI
jgi:hypothetical protein